MLLINPYRFSPSRFISNDANVVSYILAVEAADGQQLESGVITAVESFITGCKSDGIWGAIKTACILAGARTLAGALVPLVGAAPTNNNFVSGDYNRENGLKGNGSTKYLDSNRPANSSPQNDVHAAVYLTEASSLAGRAYCGSTASASGSTSFGRNTATTIFARCQSSSFLTLNGNPTGLFAIDRNNSSFFTARILGNNNTANISSQAATSKTFEFFSVDNGQFKSSGRLSYYSIGESLDLAALDARVSTLMTDLAVAI
jgi:hypothetical protein